MARRTKLPTGGLSLPENALNVFTDGSSLRSPRRGGIGIRFIRVDSTGFEEHQDAHSAGYKGATNNQMELKACIVALQEAMRLRLVDGVAKVVFHTDSLYVADNIGRAMFEWPKTRWQLRSGRPVLNADLWKELTSLMKKLGKRVEFRWVKGHAKNIHNRAADRLARQSASLPTNKPLSVVHVRRKLTEESVDVGSVPMNGQRMTIRIITTEHLSVQDIWKSKYEVVSPRSRFRGLVDIIFSEDLLAAGHTYFVQVNHETDNPRIAKILREIVPEGDDEDSGPSSHSMEPTRTAQS